MNKPISGFVLYFIKKMDDGRKKIKEIVEYLKSKNGETHIEMSELNGRLKRREEPKDMLKDWLEAEKDNIYF